MAGAAASSCWGWPASITPTCRSPTEPSANFATIALQDNLFDAVLTSWIFLAFYYSDGRLAAAFYGPQSRIMDGVLARANCLLITTLWTCFKFVLVPIGAQLTRVYSRDEFATVFALIWGSYIVTDALAEIGGSLFGKQRLRVWGIGDVNRKSIGGTVSGFAGALAFCLITVHGLPAPWIGLALVLAVSNTLFELFSPRGTDDFTMATSNALICWGFGTLVSGSRRVRWSGVVRGSGFSRVTRPWSQPSRRSRRTLIARLQRAERLSRTCGPRTTRHGPAD